MRKIIVVGDSMKDIYINIEKKINPENKAPAYLIKKQTQLPGGASNVVECLAKLGNKIVNLTDGETEKSRIFLNNKYMFRLDNDIILKNGPTFYYCMLKEIKASKAEYVIVSDYNKGYLTKDFCQKLEKTGKKLILDIKPNHLNWFKNPFLIKPNLKELSLMTKKKNYKSAGKYLANKKQCFILVTLGKKGMCLFYPNGKNVKFIPRNQKCIDVTGAGDTVISVLTHYLNLKKEITYSCERANIAAEISVNKKGCYCPTHKEIEKR